MTRNVRAFMAMMMAAVVAACSGGGDKEPTGPQEPPPPPPPPAAVASVELSPANAALYTGRTMTLQATLKDANGNTLANRPITWASSAEGTVSVNQQGVVTGVAIGDAVVTAGRSRSAFGRTRSRSGAVRPSRRATGRTTTARFP